MINVHVSRLPEYLDRGWVVVREVGTGGRVEIVDPATTCLHPTRNGPCLLKPQHRGHHATVVFYCDCCGKARRGTPHQSDGEIAICYPCYIQEYRRHAPRRRRRQPVPS